MNSIGLLTPESCSNGKIASIQDSLLALADLTKDFNSYNECQPDYTINLNLIYVYSLFDSDAFPIEKPFTLIDFISIFQEFLHVELNLLLSVDRDSIDPQVIFNLYERMMIKAHSEIISSIYGNPNKYRSTRSGSDSSLEGTIIEESSSAEEESVGHRRRIDSDVGMSQGGQENMDKIKENSVRKKKRFIPPTSKKILEDVYHVKRFPNRKEREMIARKCDLSPIQVRIWFMNKRNRSKARNN
ncbi:unnamed protein product [[Candida] boidinii]|uniref:Unnamed protein product n=1 Tax=Candida boidinii TaxID=5477 RepID=A0A9W6SYB6_CANBO|nr:hypothetical protein B5S30_g1751 [[Candida] boidinii]GME68598.1 unnamed protein product [[Candida] boidinii]